MFVQISCESLMWVGIPTLQHAQETVNSWRQDIERINRSNPQLFTEIHGSLTDARDTASGPQADHSVLRLLQISQQPLGENVEIFFWVRMWQNRQTVTTTMRYFLILERKTCQVAASEDEIVESCQVYHWSSFEVYLLYWSHSDMIWYDLKWAHSC